MGRNTWSESRLVGFLAGTRESISQLYVHVDHLREGIGSQLLRLAQAESSGTLWLYTFARNTNACRFYESHGFRAAERAPVIRSVRSVGSPCLLMPDSFTLPPLEC